jgi:rubrerythrin
MKREFDAKWDEMAEEVMSEVKEWRIAHPRATLSEIEKALDERLAKMRMRLVTDMAMASAAAEIREAEGKEQWVCSACGQGVLETRGKQERLLTSRDNQTIRLERRYGVCPHCGAGFFPSG